MIHQFLDALEFSQAQQIGVLTCWPIFGGAGAPDTLTPFAEALAAGLASVGEVTEGGVVGKLAVVNNGAAPLLLLDGEQVLGLKQNRTFNLSKIAPPGKRIEVPVSCLEHGRWAHRPEAARPAEHVHFASGRANKLRSVSENLLRRGSFASAQHEVWSDIENLSLRRGVTSPTDAEAEIAAAHAAPREGLIARITFLPGQTGFAFAVGGRLIGLDVFGAPALFAAEARRLARSYAADAVGAAEGAEPVLPDPKSLIAALRGAEPQAFAAPGAGESLRWRTSRVDAALLTFEHAVVHMTAFPVPA